jgi:hypothetical protein
MNTKYNMQKTERRKQKAINATFLVIFALLIINFKFLIFNCSAQTNQFYSLEYSTGTLVGTSHNFIDKYSWRGGHFNGQIFVLENVAIGFKLGYNNYYSGIKAQVYDNGNGLRLFANTYRYVRQAPFQVGVVGHLLPDRMFKPYFGLFMGLCYSAQSVFIQDISLGAENYGFIVTPELGFYLQINNSPVGLKASVAYNYATNKYEFNSVTFKDLQSVNVNIGLSYMITK